MTVRMRAAVLLVVLAVGVAPCAVAQTATSLADLSAGGLLFQSAPWMDPFGPGLFRLDAQPGQNTPAPYAQDEFPDWLKDVWRTTVIFVGTLPFSFFFTTEGYDLFRYATGVGTASQSPFDPTNAPWPFRPSAQITYSSNEEIGIVVATLSASAIAAAIDYFVEHGTKKP